MKRLLCLLLPALSACESAPTPHSMSPTPDTPKILQSPVAKDQSKYYATSDTFVLIDDRIGDTLKFERKEFNDIVDRHPELYEEYPASPDFAYYSSADKTGFNSEAGQDGYFMLYTYFLKQRNGISEFAERRRNLTAIYAGINELYRTFQHGGTYFGHQSTRLSAFAEFSIYLYKKSKAQLTRDYDITRQKALYIQSLRQLVADEGGGYYETAAEDVAHHRELNAIIDKINRAITDHFNLVRAQEFQYENYQYF